MFNEDTDNKIQEGLDYLNNNPHKALELFDEILKTSTDNIKALNGKGSALIKLNNYDEAEKIFKESLEIKETSGAFLNLGIISKNKEEYDEALSYYNQALNINTDLENIIKILKNDVKESMDIKERQNNLNEFSEEVRRLIEEGYKYKISERYWDALDCYELAIKEEPYSKNLVNEYIDEIKLILQKEFLLKQPQLDNTHISHYKMQAIKDLINNNQTSALININKLLEINPNDLEALNIKGAILFYLEDYEGSIYCFDKCIHIDPDYVYAFFNKGLVLRRLKRLPDAINCVNHIININQHSINVEIYQEEILERLSNILDIPFDKYVNSKN